MQEIEYFPEGIAQGDAFVNRVAERQQLLERIRANHHVVLMAPRRYGKTSLVTQVAREAKTPYCCMDFLAAYHETYVSDLVVNRVSQLAFSLLPRLKRARETLLHVFAKMKPEIRLGVLGAQLKLTLTAAPLHDITEVLLRLDETAGHFGKRAVIFMDEFQQISQLKNAHAIEAAIRHAVERSQHIAYVFSGSHRHLLQQMFAEQGRPLYRLCQVLSLERMLPVHYIGHLEKLAQRRWQKKLAQAVLARIFDVTQLHPYYMNVLCQLVWQETNVPQVATIEHLWDSYVRAQRQFIRHDVVDLSLNQRKMMMALACQPTKSIQAVEFASAYNVSASSAQQAVDALVTRDLIYQREDGCYCVLDPAMQYYLSVVLR